MKAKTVEENGFKETEIGLIPEAWESTALDNEDFFEYVNGLWKGKNPPFVKAKVLRNTNFNNDGTIYWDDVAELDVEEKQFRPRQLAFGDIILERSGGGPEQPVGRVVFFEIEKEGYSFSNFTSRIRVKNKNQLVPKFLLYYLLFFYKKGGTYDLQQRTTGIRNLSFSDYKKISIPLPIYSEQQKIVFVLSKIQQAIEQQDKIIQITKELKKSLMNKLFTEGLHGEEQKETEIGLMPKSWEVKSIGEIAPFQGGFAFKSRDYGKTGIRLFRIANVSFGKVLWEEIAFLPKEYLVQHKEYILNEGDIVMAMTRPIVSGGIKVTKLSKADCPCLLNQRVGRFNPTIMTNPNFLYHFLFTENFTNHILYGAGGSQQPNISAKKIEECLMPYPNHKEQTEIANILSNIDKKLTQAEARNQTLQSFFKTMLNQLMTGRIRVTDLDIEVN